ncbi:hypothetical protein Cgig2_012265 [Carnegiea gigantea]|uniref:Protein SCAR n=1 Tax=Carnegiea gigantea TaxID=171969 RepID=A0A9Q1QC96_9CARY|nr:hypothetical protein Cgig2_012265 [Carnegiea gigantea]
MPLSRYQIRNAYGLADQQLYKVADKDDSEDLLEGVAMAGLIGVLRQLGDLAEFAAEVFHDLHEEVMATAARGHSLIIRVQQLEAEFPLIERTLLEQTTHTTFLYNSGVGWHPKLRMNQNLVTRGDLPRFVMDSYEECRGPPQLFLLDKFDVAGAGACLKRYTDPSFFQRESISFNDRQSEGQREKKTRTVKMSNCCSFGSSRKRAPCWRNGDSPEFFPSSHVKLHQLFLQERLESSGNDLEHHVRLKKRQFSGFFLNEGNRTSYMEKFVHVSPAELKIVTATDDCELGLEIVEIGTASPLKESIMSDKTLQSSLYSRELEMKPSMDDFSESKVNEVIDSGAVELLGLNHGSDTCKILKLDKGKKCMDIESNSQVSVDDGCASEIDYYVDALATIESEIEPDSECRKTSCYSNAKRLVADFYGSEGQRRPQSLFSDSQSFGNSTTSDDGNNVFKERESSSCSVSVNSMAESTTDLEKHVVVTPDPASKSDPDDISVDFHNLSKGISRNETEERESASDGAVQGDDIPKSTQALGETSKRTDYGHWCNGELPLDDEESWNIGITPETSHDLPNTLDDFVHLAHIASRKSDSISSSVEEHVNDMGMSNLYASSGVKQSVAHTLISDAKYPQITNQIVDVPNVGFFASSIGENSEDQYAALQCTKSLNIEEQFSETNNPELAPLFDSALGTFPSSQEHHSIEKIIIDPEADEDTSCCSIVGVNEALPPVSNALQAHLLQSSFSEIAEPTEANSDYIEAAALGTVSLGAVLNSMAVFGSAEETGDQCRGNNFDVHGGSVSVVENEPDAILNGGSLKRASVSRNFTLIHRGRPAPVGTNAFLDGSGTQAIRIDVTNEHECYKYYVHDKSKDFSCHPFPSDIPIKPPISSNSTSATADNSTMCYNEVKEEHIEIVANGCRVDAEKDPHEDVFPLYSSEYLYAEKLKHRSVSLTENCLQNQQELVLGHDADLAIQQDVDAAQDAPVSSKSNMSSNGSCPLILLDGSLAEDVLNYTKLIDGAEAPLISKNGTQDLDSTSSFTPENFDNDKCLSTTLCSHAQRSFAKPPPKSAEYLLESSKEPLKSSSVYHSNVLNGSSEAILEVNTGQFDSPCFPALDMLAGGPSITLDPPPLPPLPPMQWRLGRFQNSPTAAERQIVQQTPHAIQPVSLPTTNVEAEIVARSPKTQGHRGYSDGNSSQQGVLTLPVSVAFSDLSSRNDIIGIAGEDNHSFAATQTSISSQNGSQTSEESFQPNMNPPESESTVEAHASGSCPAVLKEKLITEIGYENEHAEHIPQAVEHEAVNSQGELSQASTEHNDWNPHPSFDAPETGSVLPSTHDGIPINVDGNAHVNAQNKPLRPRNPVIDEVVAISKSKLRKMERVKPPLESKGDEGESFLEQLQLRKVGERTKSQAESKTKEIGPLVEQLQLRKAGELEADLRSEEKESSRGQLRKIVGRAHSMVRPKTDDRDSLLDQIRNKVTDNALSQSFNLRPAVMDRPNVQGPRTNLRVAAILQKASNIRQAMAGSDEDDADSWSDC